MKNRDFTFILILISVGILLRIPYLIKPIWIDEVLFYNWVIHGTRQAFLPVYFLKLYNLMFDIKDLWILRMPFVICGLATVPAIYFTFKNQYIKIFSASIMACFPLFVFWSAIAKVYVIAWLFIILAWNYPVFYMAAVLTTPLAVIGFNLFKIKKNLRLYIFLIVIAVIMFMVRNDTGRNFLNWRFLIHAKRIWTLFFVSGLLHICQYLDQRFMGKRVCKLKI